MLQLDRLPDGAMPKLTGWHRMKDTARHHAPGRCTLVPGGKDTDSESGSVGEGLTCLKAVGASRVVLEVRGC